MDYNTIKLTALKQPVYDFFIVSDGGFMIALDDKNNIGSLYFQIYSQLKDDIQSGKLKAGTKLLSKRKMAERLSVSAVSYTHLDVYKRQFMCICRNNS